MTFKEYSVKVRKAKEYNPRKANIHPSKYIVRKILKEHPEFNINREDYQKMIRTINQLLAEEFLNKGKLVFPYRLGAIRIAKYTPIVRMIDGKLYRTTVINWKATCELWYTNKKAEAAKTLVRYDPKPFYCIRYGRNPRNYVRLKSYDFIPSRTLYHKLKERIDNDKIYISYE